MKVRFGDIYKGSTQGTPAEKHPCIYYLEDEGQKYVFVITHSPREGHPMIILEPWQVAFINEECRKLFFKENKISYISLIAEPHSFATNPKKIGYIKQHAINKILLTLKKIRNV